MGRILFFVVIAAALYFGWRVWRVKQIQENSQKDRAPHPITKTPDHKMVQCDHCGLYLDEAEAIHKDGHYYCCKQHMIAGPKNNEN